MISRVVWRIVKFVCYVALAIVFAGVASLFVPSMLGLCSHASGGTLKCNDPMYHRIFEFGYTVVMLTVFTGIPGLLAMGGLVFLIRDVFWRRRCPKQP